MFSFFQTIFHKITTVVATVAIAIGLVSAPKPIEQPILDNQNPVVVEQQVKESESQIQNKQSEVSISDETKNLKKEIEDLKKSINQQNQSSAIINQPTQQVVQPQPQKTVPPRPENSDDWTFNWDTWAWEKHPTAPPIAPTINLQQPSQNAVPNQQVQYENTSRIQEQNKNSQINTLLAEYNQKINDIDEQIIAIENKYYKDVETVSSFAGGTQSILNGQIAALADNANWEIQKLRTQKESLRLQYLSKINSVQ